MLDDSRVRELAVIGARAEILRLTEFVEQFGDMTPANRKALLAIATDEGPNGHAPKRRGRPPLSAAPAVPVRKKRKMTAAARKRISEAQKLRWANTPR